MRVNMGREGRTSSSLSANGGSMLGALILANGPSQPLEAATKYYVDSTFASLNANNVLDGVLPISSLPGFTGDATSPQGSNVITLTNLGVTPGSYAKVIVDAKGRVTGNDILTESDIPVIGWDKVQNKPNTLEGYGITDALSVTGGVFDGQMSVIAPTNSMSAVNKQYVDAALSGNSAVVGDIIRKPFASTPSGFLRCNGGMVDKVMYADLYSIIGDNFNKYTVAGSGRPWQQQYEINSEQSGDLTGWSFYGNLPEILHTGMFAVTKNRVYKFGGASTNNGYFTTVYYANINSDGSLGAWTNGINLPTYILNSSVIVLKNKLYIIGGFSPTGPLSTVYTAPINADGSLGSWSIYNNLPAPIASSATFITKNRIYTLGGYNSSSIPVATVYYANISSDGSIGNWVADTALPSAVAAANIFVTKNRVYLCGGIGATSNLLSTVYAAPINPDGTIGTWTTGVALPVATYNAQYFATKTRAYIIGGVTASNRTAAVYSAPINQDGTLGSWGAGTSLPYAVSNAHSFIVKNKLYLLGGGTNSDWLSAIYSCPVYGGKNDYSSYYSVGHVNYLMPGSGKPWQQQYQINTAQSTDITGWTTTTTLPAIQGNSAVLVTKNRVYLIGGKDNSGYLDTVRSASINADGTLGSWTTEISFPIAISDAQLVTTKAHVYMIGGRNASGYLNVVYSASINADGSIGSWTKQAEYVYQTLSGSGSFNLPLQATNVTIRGKGANGSIGPGTWNNPYFYYALGSVGGDYVPEFTTYTGASLPPTMTVTNFGSTYTAILAGQNLYSFNATELQIFCSYTYTAGPTLTGASSSITVDGTTYTYTGGVGTVATQQTNNLTFPGTASVPVSYNIASGGYGQITYSFGNYLPAAMGSGKVFVTKNRIYMVGGYVNGAYSSAVYTATIDSNGVIGAWSATTSLPGVLAFSSLAVTCNRVYLIGGSTDGNNSVSTVYTAPIAENGVIGTWTTGTSLNTAVCKASVFVTANKLYVIGGNTANNTAGALVQTAPINSDGTLGAWVSGTSLPGVLSESSLIAIKDHIYLLNGSTGSAYVNTNYMASIVGSVNDYVSYYDGSIVAYETPNPTDLFALPDFSSKEKNGVNLYIKY